MIERNAGCVLRDAGIAGGAEQPIDQRARRHLPGERMLTPAGAEKKNVHIWSAILAHFQARAFSGEVDTSSPQDKCALEEK
jgi:hypothetical protein